MASYRGEIIALLAGLSLVFSFAPFNCAILAYFCPAVLLLCFVYSPSTKRSFLRGWCFGFGLFSFGVYWISISLHDYGHLSWPIAACLTALLAAILALFYGLVGLALQYYFPDNTRNKLARAFPAMYALIEWLRSLLFTGFPWLALGYSQTDTVVRPFAQITGVFGISLFCAVNAGGWIFIVFASRKQKINAALYLAAWWVIIFSCQYLPVTIAQNPPLQVTLVQGNISQANKWNPEQLPNTLQTYVDLSANHWDSDLIVWPEAAVPALMQQVEPFLNHMDEQAKQHHTGLLLGLPIENVYGTAYYNAVMAIGKANGLYLKHHLVPFGEYNPLPSLTTPIMQFFGAPAGQFTSGQAASTLLSLGHYKIAAFICYEIAFPEDVSKLAANANIIVAVSDDIWFGDSFAKDQHLQMARMRAIENAKPVLFATNTGISAFIDSQGHIQAQAPIDQRTTLTHTVTPRAGQTLWSYRGIDQFIILCVSMLFLAFLRRKRVPIIIPTPRQPKT